MPMQRTQDKLRPLVPVLGEYARGVQATEQAPSPAERRRDGTFAKGARTLQSQGGRALKCRTALSHSIGLADVDALPAFKPYQAQGKAFAKAHITTLSRSVGGGICDEGAASVVTTAALQLAASRFLFDQASITGDADMFLKAAKLGDQSRANLLSAAELCAMAAKKRPKTAEAYPWLTPAPRADASENAPRAAGEGTASSDASNAASVAPSAVDA